MDNRTSPCYSVEQPGNLTSIAVAACFPPLRLFLFSASSAFDLPGQVAQGASQLSLCSRAHHVSRCLEFALQPIVVGQSLGVKKMEKMKIQNYI